MKQVIGVISLPVRCDRDIMGVRQRGRWLAAQQGFSSGDQVLIATAVSELARNIVQYARDGVVDLRAVSRENLLGIEVAARDRGPGMVNAALALQDGFSTSRGLGLGLPGVARVVDEFLIESTPGQGTIVTMTKWRSRGPRRPAHEARADSPPRGPAAPAIRPSPPLDDSPGETPPTYTIPPGLWHWVEAICWRN